MGSRGGARCSGVPDRRTQELRADGEILPEGLVSAARVGGKERIATSLSNLKDPALLRKDYGQVTQILEESLALVRETEGPQWRDSIE
jgi:hypothetical protein